MKSLKSLLASLLALAFAAVPACTQELKTPEQVLEYLGQHRQDVALASYSVRPDGTLDPADPVILFNADQRMALASTVKIVVLAAYAREVTAGRLDPDQSVRVEDWERYYLPTTDGGAHPAALQSLGIPSDPLGFATNRAATVKLDSLANVMIKLSDNAATDYLMARLGRKNLQSILQQGKLAGQEVPLSLLGTFLTWYNPEDGLLTPARVSKIQKLAKNPRRYAEQVDRLAAAYGNPKWRQAAIDFLLAREVSYELEAAVASVSTRGTARDYARIMAGVVTGTFLSPEISALMRRHLEIPLPHENLFRSWGTKGGSLAGMLTEANYYVPSTGAFAGKPRVTVLFLRQIEATLWEQLMTGGGFSFFDARLARDQEFAQLARQMLGVTAP